MSGIIPEKIVTAYALAVQRIKEAEAEKQELRQKVLGAFAKGWTCSAKGPYLLEHNIQERRQTNWKQEAIDLLKQHYEDWESRLGEIEKNAPIVSVDRLEVKVNPKYKEKNGYNTG